MIPETPARLTATRFHDCVHRPNSFTLPPSLSPASDTLLPLQTNRKVGLGTEWPVLEIPSGHWFKRFLAGHWDTGERG